MIYEKTTDGIKLFVKVAPKASATQIRGVETLSSGQDVLKVFVTVVPEDGKANKAVITLLSKSLKIAKSHFTILQGETSRLKTFLITGPEMDIISKIESILNP